jgi:hypothetical protein
MREILEDAALIYRQEADTVLTLVAPLAVVSLVLLIVVSFGGLAPGVTALAGLVLAYALGYAASLHWAGSIATTRMFGRGRPAWVEVLLRGPQALLVLGPACVLAVFAGSVALVVAREGFWYLSAGIGGIAAAAAAPWVFRHAYDLPLVVLYEASSRDALDAGARLSDETRDWTARLVLLTSIPLALGAAVAGLIALPLGPVAGAAIFLIVVSAWMPYWALVMASACAKVLDETATAPSSGARAGQLS